MRSEHLLRFVVINGLAVAAGAVVATSCIKVNYPTVAFRCSPRQGDNCPATHFCCSDDPSTEDGSLPSYVGREISGGNTPLYADLANGAGTSGMCVRTKDIPLGSGLTTPPAMNCPIPCNPTWSEGDIRAVCGESSATSKRTCCQTVELGEQDCVQEDGVWRPVTGADIGVMSVVPTTVWGPASHDTHQDPNGTVCLALGGGDPQSATFLECIRHLTVANQRGFCMSLKIDPLTGSEQVCPTNPAPPPEGAGYISICDRKNGMVPPG